MTCKRIRNEMNQKRDELEMSWGINEGLAISGNELEMSNL